MLKCTSNLIRTYLIFVWCLMEKLYKHEVALLNQNGACSQIIRGLMRKDETAVVVSPEYEDKLKNASTLRYRRKDSEICEFRVTGYYQDRQASFANEFIKPIVVQLSKYL